VFCFVSYFEVPVSRVLCFPACPVSLWLSALVLIVSSCVIASSALIVSTCVSSPVSNHLHLPVYLNPVCLIPHCGFVLLSLCLWHWLVHVWPGFCKGLNLLWSCCWHLGTVLSPDTIVFIKHLQKLKWKVIHRVHNYKYGAIFQKETDINTDVCRNEPFTKYLKICTSSDLLPRWLMLLGERSGRGWNAASSSRAAAGLTDGWWKQIVSTGIWQTYVKWPRHLDSTLRGGGTWWWMCRHPQEHKGFRTRGSKLFATRAKFDKVKMPGGQ